MAARKPSKSQQSAWQAQLAQLSSEQLLNLSQFYSLLYARIMLDDPDPHYPVPTRATLESRLSALSESLPRQQTRLGQARTRVESLLKQRQFQQARQYVQEAQLALARELYREGRELPAAVQEAQQQAASIPSNFSTPDQLPEAVWEALPLEIKNQWAARRAAQR